jgi:hypothetical protein
MIGPKKEKVVSKSNSQASNIGSNNALHTIIQKIVTLIFTSFAVCGFITNVFRNAKLLLSLVRHAAAQDGEDVPPLCVKVVAFNIACICLSSFR